MTEIYALAVMTLLAAGAMAGILIILALGIRREEKAYSLTIGSPGRFASGARAATGAYARIPGVTRQASHRQQDLALARPGRQPE